MKLYVNFLGLIINVFFFCDNDTMIGIVRNAEHALFNHLGCESGREGFKAIEVVGE